MARIALALSLLAGPALADASLSIPFGPEAEVIAQRYSCEGGEPFPVQYVNAGPNRLALIPIDGEQLVFVNVISGSGARYVAGPFEWWSKGDEAMLGNAMDDAAGKTCRAVGDDTDQ